MRSHFGLRGLSVNTTNPRSQASLQRVLLFLSAVETLDRAQHDCLQKYGLRPHKNKENS